jgi:transcriptional regulator of acetoin/glycerol metabolism
VFKVSPFDTHKLLQNGTLMQIQHPTSDWLATSWDRSSEAGLKQRRLPDHVKLSVTELKERTWAATHLIKAVENYALPLFNQIFAHSDSRLLLTDPDGVILSSWGQPRFKERLLDIALESGACWQERIKGTNAIGTAIIESRPVTIIGKQHFIFQHQFISCSANPIFNHYGELIGILDITSDHQIHDISTQALVQNMVQLIENHLLCDIPHSATRINIACEKTLLNSGWQGVIITDDSGTVLAHNQIASQLLARPSVIGHKIDELFAYSPQNLVFEKLQLTASKNQHSSLSASTELHFGDPRIEQAWQQANKLIDKDISLLILGETGVGKSEFVKALHKQSTRKHKPLVSVNCGAIPKDLIESELFGYAAGAFTGANSKGYQGKIRQAEKGILFLDEIADMPLEAQTRLLHVLQDKVVVPVGSNQSYPVDTQIIAATHKNLEQLVAQGAFRQDLFYRLNGLIIELPSLRERDDQEALIIHIHNKYKLHQQTLSPSLIDLLKQYHWPGNIRELDNILKVSSLLASDEPILKVGHVPSHIRTSLTQQIRGEIDDENSTVNLKITLDSQLLSTYNSTQGNISKTSRMLGISRNTIYRKLKSLKMIE